MKPKTTAPVSRRDTAEDGPPWIVLTVDDEPDIHDVLRLAIGRSRFFGRRIEFKSAFSSLEAQKLLGDVDRSRLVVAIVDVVMEHDRAGLELVDRLRAQFGSPLQIILNTGQPHIMAAEEVAMKYEISAYLSKPEVTPERLKTLINVCIRNFRKFTAMQVLCDSLSTFVTLFENATTTEALDQLLASALLQYSTVWQFSYVFAQDLEAPAASDPWEQTLLNQLRSLELGRGASSFVRLDFSGSEEVWGAVVQPLTGRFSTGFALSQSERPSDVLLHELQLLLRSWVLTRESIDLKQMAAEEQRVREGMHRERRELIAQMVAGVAHEVNTPLGVANAAASTLSAILTSENFRRLKDSSEFREDMADLLQGLHLIEKNIARADELIRTFRKLSVGQLVDKREELAIGQCVKEVIDLWGPEAKRGQIKVQFRDQLTPSCSKWIGYAGHLSQIVLNLLANARRYAYEEGSGGQIDVTISSKMVDDKAEFQLEVADYGAGIPKENLPQIFEAFFTTGRSKGGTGLGLSIVQNLVTSVFGGTIRCESEVGKGTRFVINFSHCKEQKTPEPAGHGDEGASADVQTLEDFLLLQRKLANGSELSAQEQIHLADVKGALEAYLAKRFGSRSRRGTLRVPVRRKVKVDRLSQGVELQTDVHELSTMGASHSCKEKLQIGEKLRATYSAESPRVVLECEVISCHDFRGDDGSGSSCLIGVRFGTLSDDVAGNLKLLIAQLLLAQVGVAPGSGIVN